MDSWDNLILQWINCLLNSTANCIQSIEELQDGKIYLTLINRVKRFKQKIGKSEVSEKDIVVQFLKDEYPNCVFGMVTQEIENLCIALLILSRLSLEATFHKSLCSNLNLDIQIRIKSILESIYPLGKKVTVEDLCSTFSLLDKSATNSVSAKPKYLLEDFLNSPVIRSVHSDSKIHEQTRQIRRLQADLETVRYEKSELIEDIKMQKKQIDDLHQKLQETLLELKTLRQDSLKSNDFNGSYEPTTSKSFESSYDKELQSLENYISELQSDNFKLQDKKTSLLNELKICQSKYSSIEEKSLKHEEMIESLLVQIESKDNELVELKIKYEELCVYLKEKSKPSFINQSFDADDRAISENSIINNSEPLSSVIEIQLQDAKKEIIEAQNKYKGINSLLTIIMEEYVKLKKTVQMLSTDNAKIRAEYEDKYKIMNDQLQQFLNQEKLEKESQLQKYNELDLSDIKQNITRILQGDSEEMKSLLLKFLSQFNASKGVKKLYNYIDFATVEDSAVMDSEYLNTLKSLQKYQGDKSINNIDRNRLVFKFYDIIWQENWRKNLVIFFKTLVQNHISGGITDNTTDHKKIIAKYHTIDVMLEKNLIKCLQDLYNRNEADKGSLITKEDLEIIRSDWISLYNDIKDNLKIYKVMLLLEKKWNIVSESFRNYENYLIEDVRELLEKKDAINSEFSKIFFMNSQILSSNFIAATQLTTKINKSKNDKMHIGDVNDSMLKSKDSEDLLTHSECIEKIMNINKSIEDFETTRKSIEEKPKIKIEWANISMQTELEETEPTVETEYANVSIQTELVETEPTVGTEHANISIQTELVEPTVETEYANISIQTELVETDPTVGTEHANISIQTELVEPTVETEYANISIQTELVETDPTVGTEHANISIQTELVEHTVGTEYANISIQTELAETEPTVGTEFANISIQTENPEEFSEVAPVVKIVCADVSLQTESFTESLEADVETKTECVNVSLQTEDPTEFLETAPVIKVECANVSLQTDNSIDEPESVIKTKCIDISMQTDNVIDESEPVIKSECIDISMQTEDMLDFIETKPVEKIECIDVSLQTETETEAAVKIECANVSLQTDNLTEFANVSLQTSIVEPIETPTPAKVECMNISMQTDNPVELLETKPIIKTECLNVSIQTEDVQITEAPVPDVKHKIKVEKEILQQQTRDSKENILNKTAKSSRNVLESEEVQNYVKELHEKYELKLEKMKDKMKTVFNSQMSALKKEQESGPVAKKLKALEEQLEQQCHNHSEELKKYKKHVSELSTQLWEVGDKLLIEKQKKEEIIHKYKDLKTKLDIMEAHNSKPSKYELKSHDHQVTKAEVERQPLQQLEVSAVSKMQNVRNFQVMGNAFRTEDEEGELFDTTYNLSELQRSQNIPPPNDLDRLSILQSRNAKCRPHLKSSYAAELQSYPLPVTEDEIKSGSATEEVFNDSLSQSLLTGKKVKRRDRTRNGSETPRRSTRRFSNIFRKPRLSLDRK